MHSTVQRRRPLAGNRRSIGDPVDGSCAVGFLVFFEAGRAEAIRQLGSLDAEVAACALAAPVLEATIRYRAPATFDEVLVIQTKVVDIANARFRFAYEIRRAADQVLIATGETLHAWTGVDSSHTDDLPDWFRTALEQLRAAD